MHRTADALTSSATHAPGDRPAALTTTTTDAYVNGGRDRLVRRLLLIALCLPVSGCIPIGATIVGLGFSHQIGGIQYRTFTEPLPKVSRATLLAFKRMAMKIDKVERTKNGEFLSASTSDRKFEVALEALTPNTTRMRSVARNQLGIIVDSSTAMEVIRQAEKVLEPEVLRKRSSQARVSG